MISLKTPFTIEINQHLSNQVSMMARRLLERHITKDSKCVRRHIISYLNRYVPSHIDVIFCISHLLEHTQVYLVQQVPKSSDTSQRSYGMMNDIIALNRLPTHLLRNDVSNGSTNHGELSWSH
ncbi:hypothetical protein CDAR_520601 [Caerostris darwini]|uniref:Uncharacterized protein n=1 Tax=Caerostris darwini TaxID=1538125 RepID=A0AAV4W8J2_9ARAC|nr:hypothetical protein CDAR_520601 [Caerostris darwini]